MTHVSTIYLLHFDRSYKARHYLGYTENLEQRLEQHRAGHGSPLVAVAIAAGISFEVAATWPGDRNRERPLHHYKNSRARLCPICRANLRAAAPTPSRGPGRQPPTRSWSAFSASWPARSRCRRSTRICAARARPRRQRLRPSGAARGDRPDRQEPAARRDRLDGALRDVDPGRAACSPGSGWHALAGVRKGSDQVAHPARVATKPWRFKDGQVQTQPD